MKKRVISVLAVVMAMVFLAAGASAKVKYLSMEQFGISVKVKNLYSQKGKSAVGTVVNATKARLGAGMSDARQGQQVRATYLGDGFVEVKNMTTGTNVTIEVKEHVP
jgi:uncharacterized membrane protein